MDMEWAVWLGMAAALKEMEWNEELTPGAAAIYMWLTPHLWMSPPMKYP